MERESCNRVPAVGMMRCSVGRDVLRLPFFYQFFRIIEDQADRMDALIGHLLDAGRIEAGTLAVAPLPSDLPALGEQARTTILSGGAHHQVVVDLPPDLPR